MLDHKEDKIVLIGDVHAKFDQYIRLAEHAEYSVQLGDMGFSYERLEELDPNKSKFIKGNHDNHNISSRYELGRFGSYELNGVKFFFVSGGYSIDDGLRRQGRVLSGEKTWWHQEQLTFVEMEECKKLYLEEKPHILLSHSPCRFIINRYTDPRIIKNFGFDKDFSCQTSLFLDHLFSLHKPLCWVAGHIHCSYEERIDGCVFKGLSELETCLVTSEGNIL